MITGDHAVTAAAIAAELGIEGRAITGAEFAAMGDDAARRRASTTSASIARVTPEDKVRLVDMLKRKGHIVAMTGDGVNDAPGAQEGRHRHRDGHHRHRGLQGGRRDDPHRRQLRHHRQGRRARPRPLRQPQKYIRFQMGALIGFIVTFLGASIFNIAAGVPFLPLQTLWVNFTTQVFQAIGLGYGKPAPGLMQRKPRPAERAAAAAAGC